jgi:hypothetical protein
MTPQPPIRLFATLWNIPRILIIARFSTNKKMEFGGRMSYVNNAVWCRTRFRFFRIPRSSAREVVDQWANKRRVG